MGHRMEFYTDENTAQDIITVANRYNIKAQIIGHVERLSAGSPRLTIKSSEGIFNYR